jgi:hypothetical protein
MKAIGGAPPPSSLTAFGISGFGSQLDVNADDVTPHQSNASFAALTRHLVYINMIYHTTMVDTRYIG